MDLVVDKNSLKIGGNYKNTGIGGVCVFLWVKGTISVIDTAHSMGTSCKYSVKNSAVSPIGAGWTNMWTHTAPLAEKNGQLC